MKFGQIDKIYKKFSQNRTKWVDIFRKVCYIIIREGGKATFFHKICTKFNFFNFTPLTFWGTPLQLNQEVLLADSGIYSHFIQFNIMFLPSG